MKTYRLEFTQKLPVDLDTAWGFFSSPSNLVEITPKNMTFDVTSPDMGNTKMYPGLIITYKVSPLFGIKLNWVTEITHVKDKEYFIDEQRFGPFAFWHHQHHFEKIDGGVFMHDTLHYSIGWGPVGAIANAIVVNNKINEIFKFRYQKVEELFGKL
ncbi:SRPBCC family protein [Pedobacter sp. ISL-68]|uniref:SRPBCC family protein n=1 Tax=unclassified Pedobacter TaxID=2628915 RepID=UPI001BEC4E89|nr:MULTISPECIES: SRPBCC family protein [unclassified Pedobacter]MBT2563538.1 SRPBCC family protein [Pedobacter sp. ISL-64]MBT2592841.1 SRPBCC family protein [Pedobacter sp. ISL-68]